MKYAALITAAGMSSRMGEFKPMLNMGSISIAQRVVSTFRQAGVERIVMVTGCHAQELERHLSGNGIVFLRNENYENSQMFDSVKIGMSYLREKCSAVLFTPVDIPLFTVDTVRALIESGADLISPAYRGSAGHPILISAKLIDTILTYSGKSGLRGALERCGEKMRLLPVNDEGILYDADTPEDYSRLLRYHNSQLIRPVTHVELVKETSFLDRRIAMLLMLIDETKSVRKACQRMQISYSTGWKSIRALESQLDCTLVLRTQGGAGGGASELTGEAKTLLERYHKFEQSVQKFAVEQFDTYFGELFSCGKLI